MHAQAPREPQFLEEVNALLEVATGDYLPLDFEFNIENPDDGFEHFVYRTCLRAIAVARRHDRESASNELIYLPHHFNETWELTTRRIATIAMNPRISFLARQHVVIREAQQSFEERWEELRSELYADQQPYALDLIASLRKAPKRVSYYNRQGELRQKEVFGATAIAPTGAGKTHLMEMCATVVADSAIDRSIVLVSPSLALQRQLIRKFSKGLPHLRIGGMSSEVNDLPAQNDIMIITIDAFNTHFRNNKLSGHPVDMLMIDEVHHLTAPEFSQTWLEHWDGHTLGFTATPAYSLYKDVRAMLPRIVEHSDTLGLIDAERLNDGQIFTFIIDDDLFRELTINYGINPDEAQSNEMVRYIIDSLVIDFVKPFLEEGRRGIIFCEPGNTAWNARELARRLREETELADGRPIRAEAMYSEAGNQHDIIERYHNGELDVITTIDSGRESLDAAFNFDIMNCIVKSRLRGRQMVGRGLRPNEQFGVTIFAQFINDLRSHVPFDHSPFLIEEAFDDFPIKFHQGRTLRGSRGQTRGGEGHQTSDDGQSKNIPANTFKLQQFIPLIQKALAKIDRRPIGESFLSSRRNAWILEEGMEPLENALADYDIRPTRAMKILRDAGYGWRGKFEEIDGQRKFVHYYQAEAIAYLHSRLPKGVMLDRLEAAAHLDITPELFDYLIDQPANEIVGREVARPNRKSTICYGEEAIAMAERAIKRVPGLQSGDRPVQDVAREMGIDPRSLQRLIGIQDSKRYLVKGAFYITAAEIAEAHHLFYGMPQAEPTDKNINALEEMLGTADPSFVRRHLTEQEKKKAIHKRYQDKRGYTLHGLVWEEKDWKAIISRLEKIKPRPLEAHLIHLNRQTLSAMVRYGSEINVNELTDNLKSEGYSVEDIAIVNNKVRSMCVAWQVIADLQRKYGEPRLTRRTPRIDFNRLPSGPHDQDPEKIAYAQEIQRRFLQPTQLKNYQLH